MDSRKEGLISFIQLIKKGVTVLILAFQIKKPVDFIGWLMKSRVCHLLAGTE